MFLFFVFLLSNFLYTVIMQIMWFKGSLLRYLVLIFFFSLFVPLLYPLWRFLLVEGSLAAMLFTFFLFSSLFFTFCFSFYSTYFIDRFYFFTPLLWLLWCFEGTLTLSLHMFEGFTAKFRICEGKNVASEGEVSKANTDHECQGWAMPVC